MIPLEDNEETFETSTWSATTMRQQDNNCTVEEARAMKDGNDAVLRQCEIKKIQMEYSKSQVGHGSKSLSSLNMTEANVDWSGFSGAAHKFVGNKPGPETPRNSLQSQALLSQKNDQNGANNSRRKIEKLDISRRILLQIAKEDGSIPIQPSSSENLLNVPTNSEQNNISRRSSSRRNLMADLAQLSSGNNIGQKFRRRRTIAGGEGKEPSSTRLQRILNSNRSERHLASTDCSNAILTTPSHASNALKGPISIAIASSRGVAASSTTFGLGKKKSQSKAKSRKSNENVLGSELKKQSSITW